MCSSVRFNTGLVNVGPTQDSSMFIVGLCEPRTIWCWWSLTSLTPLFKISKKNKNKQINQIYLEKEIFPEILRQHIIQGTKTKQYDYKSTEGYYAMGNFDLAKAVIGVHLWSLLLLNPGLDAESLMDASLRYQMASSWLSTGPSMVILHLSYQYTK